MTHLELGVETGGLVRALGDLVGLGLLSGRANHLFVVCCGIIGGTGGRWWMMVARVMGRTERIEETVISDAASTMR